MRKDHRGPSSRISGLGVLVIIALGVAIGVIGLNFKRWELGIPEVTFDREFATVGKNPVLNLSVADAGSGLSHVTVRIKQKEGEIALVDEALNNEPSKSYDLGKLLVENAKLSEGPATLTVTAADHGLLRFFQANRAEVTKEFKLDTTPPTLEVFSGQHYINQGGSDGVAYRVSEDVEVSGVQAGPYFFPGFPASKSDPKMRFALFALAYNLPADTKIQVVARDGAANEAKAGFWQKVFPHKPRERDIPIDDNFLGKVIPEILSHSKTVKDSGEPIKTFVDINSNLRKENHTKIAELAKASPGEFLWNGAFVQLSNSQVESFFADRRSYMYQGKKVDEQDHVGFDLSVVQHYPIEAANDGKVILAEYFGIYGNTVLIDHGAGLISLYGHMSSIDVKPGQMVKKKEVLGKSGETGLAGGDHLHFGMFLHGVPVDPREWWDAHWITDHVTDRLK
ncbi:MAG TPA: M23 family metallopeptidase, partial [Terriglobia bacterium]|nr:M23 family metallopeptidase [Terriglobia bacterium]